MKRKRKLNLFFTFFLIGLIPLITTLFVTIFYSSNQLKKEIVNNIYLRLKTCAVSVEQYFEWDIAEEILCKDETSYEFIDSLMEDDIVLTLFEKDTSFISSIKDDKGNRVEGIKADAEI